MNYEKNINKRAIAKRVIIIWMFGLFIGGLIGFCIGCCVGTKVKSHKLEEDLKMDKLDEKISEIQALQKELDHRTEVEKEAMKLIAEGKDKEALQLLKTIE